MPDSYQTIRFYRRQIPAFACIPGCNDCCGPIMVPSIEATQLPAKSAHEHAVALENLSCPYLGQNGCEVYAERPLICRTFGVARSLPCPHGLRPHEMLAPELEQGIDDFLNSQRRVLL